MDYRDVTHADFKSRRIANPLEPKYIFQIEEGSPAKEIGPIEGKKSIFLPAR